MSESEQDSKVRRRDAEVIQVPHLQNAYSGWDTATTTDGDGDLSGNSDFLAVTAESSGSGRVRGILCESPVRDPPISLPYI